jgi:predicted enzyme involved in methoxymalonyl-ACP biosynthesis
MSCRVLNRDVEALILNPLRQIPNLCGEYLPTEQNATCANVYAQYDIPSPLSESQS